MKLKKYLLFANVILACTLNIGCSKIKLPAPDAKELFHQWQYLNSSGGFSGGQTDESFTTASWVEYTERGFYKEHKNGKEYTQRYNLETSQPSSTGKYIIDYKNKLGQSFEISHDTLFLYDEASDAFSYVFVRKK